MTNDLIMVKQLPIIEEQLKKISDDIDTKIAHAKSLICTEETVKEVKVLRASLTKEFADLETKRKEVKTQVLEPYNQFEAVYKQYVSDKFKTADTELKQEIDEVENSLKDTKQQEVIAYFNEYRDSKNLGFLTFEQANINVTLSASMKSLKEQAKAFIDKVDDDLVLIDMQDYKAEILVEYKKSLNASQAITTVLNRHKEIEEETTKQTEKEQQKQAESIVVEKVDDVLPAPTIKAETLTLSFKVTDTMDRLREVKKFLDDGGYKYE